MEGTYFDEFWRELEAELGTCGSFNTLSRPEPFDARMTVGRKSVEVTPGSGTARDVKRGEFGRVWNVMKGVPIDERYFNRDGRYSEVSRNSSYILALIRHVVGDGGDMSGTRPRRPSWRTP